MGPGYPIICFFAWNLWRASKMCCRYSCQNGHAILAQVLPLRSSISKKFRLPFLAHGCVEPSGKRTGNFAMASVSVIDRETNDGEDYLLIDMPEAEAAPAEAPPLGRTRLSTELAQNCAAWGKYLFGLPGQPMWTRGWTRRPPLESSFTRSPQVLPSLRRNLNGPLDG